jgi:fructoselysine 3-epimerase
MKLSFSTNAFVKYSARQAVERIAAIGYEGVELLADAPHLYADSVTSVEMSELVDVLGRTGIKVANINANTAMGFYADKFWEPLFEPSLANPEPELRRWRIEYTKKCIDLACELGGANVSVTSGKMVSGISPEKSLDILAKSLEEVLNYAETKRVRIGIEYEPGLLIERCEELLALMSRLKSPYLGANLDLGHSHLLGERPEEVIKALGSSIFHVHLEDIRGSKHYHLVPGTGDIDFRKLFTLLNNVGYSGFATVELYTYPHEPEAVAEQALNYLRGIKGIGI